MLNLYNKKRLSEKEVNIADPSANFFTPSIFVLSEYSKFEETFWDTFDNHQWKGITSECIRSTLINLMFTGKIKVIHFIDRTSFFFHLIKFQSEGYNIFYVGELATEDVLTNNFLDAIKVIQPEKKGNVSSILKAVINIYLGTETYRRPQKRFFYEYLIRFAKSNKWIKLKVSSKLLGTITNYDIDIDSRKKEELKNSYRDFKTLVHGELKRNFFFREFLTYLEEKIQAEFLAKYPSD
jgi:hypothetical protein